MYYWTEFLAFVAGLTIEQWQLITANFVGLLFLVVRCAAFAAQDKRLFLVLDSVATVLNLAMYAILGLWLACVAIVASIVRNVYNTRPRPLLLVNMLILAAIVAVCVWLEKDNDFDIVAYLPIVGIIIYSLSIFLSKSFGLLMMASVFNDLLMGLYDLKNIMVMGLVTDLIGIVMPGFRWGISLVEQHYRIIPLGRRIRIRRKPRERFFSAIQA